MSINFGRRAILRTIVTLPLVSPLAALGAIATKPLIVLLEADPWLMVIGSDSPAFALYDDGEIIYRAKNGYKSIKLSAVEMDALVASLDVRALSALARHYDADDATDQPTETLFLYNADKVSIASVYGSLDTPAVRSRIPTKLSLAFDKLKSFDSPNAQSWLPEKIEVMISSYEYAPDVSIIWPKGWPGLRDPDTVRRGEENYSIFVSSAKYAELSGFLASRKEKGAVKIDGKKWSVSVRFPFPGERSWMALASN